MPDINKLYSLLVPGNDHEIREPYDLFTMREDTLARNICTDAEVAIVVYPHDRPEKLRNCIESILENTDDVSYYVLAMDDSRDPDARSYLSSLISDKVRLIRFDTPTGKGYKRFISTSFIRTPYVAYIDCDVIVTKGWLSNLLRCMKSAPDIGYVAPMSTNVSNLQQVNFTIGRKEELAARAEAFNRSDPKKWQERMRLIDMAALCRCEMLPAVGSFDIGFKHDFIEDDFEKRVRAAGYRLMLCGDTFVHHDHDFRNMEDKDPKAYEESLRIGRAHYKQKYHGLDAWDDVNNFEMNLISLFRPSADTDMPRILGIDCRMGTPILELKNAYRKIGVFDAECHAFTTEAKYFADLQTICDDRVVCDHDETVNRYFSVKYFDAVILGEPLNSYADPLLLLSHLFCLLRPGGQLLLKLKNTQSASELLQIIGTQEKARDTAVYLPLTIEELGDALDTLGAKDVRLSKTQYNTDAAFQTNMKNLLRTFSQKSTAEINKQYQKLQTAEYCVCIEN